MNKGIRRDSGIDCGAPVKATEQPPPLEDFLPQSVPFMSHWGVIPLSFCSSFNSKTASSVLPFGLQTQILLAQQLHPTSSSNLMISETSQLSSPEHASPTNPLSLHVEVQRVASHVNPSSTPLLF